MRRAALIAAAFVALAGPASAQFVVQFDFGPPPPHGSFWENAPPTLADRIRITHDRMYRLHQMGVIVGPEWDWDATELDHITILFNELKPHDGGRLTQSDHQWLWNRLNNLSQRLHWQASMGF